MKRYISTILIFAIIAALIIPITKNGLQGVLSTNPFESYDNRWDALTSKNYTSSDLGKCDDSNTVLYNYIVKFKDTADLDLIHECVSKYEYKQLAHSNERVFSVYITDIISFKDEYKAIIKYAESNGSLKLCATVNDPLADSQWELDALELYNGWDVNTHNREIIVAVLDSGIYRQHEDFAGIRILPGYDAVNSSAGVNVDVNGHGTKVTSIIAASSDNSIGMAGVCDELTILPIRVSDSTGYVYSADFIEAVYFAADSGAKVINMSFGGYVYSAAEEAAVEYAAKQGCILVSAAGNEGVDLDNAGKKAYPASYNNVISVGASDDSGDACSFSQYNDAVDLLAPGYGVTVADSNGGYSKEEGTSFAAPYVSGVIGLALLAIDDGVSFTADEFVTLVADLNASPRNDRDGYGVINANTVLRSINRPLYSGVINNGVYHKNITVTFNRGTAWLDGEEFHSGDIVKTSGKHTIEISDNMTVVEVSFITDNIPLKYNFVEKENEVNITFTRGNAYLDGVPYLSGTPIKTEGSHYFTIVGPYGNSETFEFDCSFTAPTVFGVANGGYYTTPVHIASPTQGVLTLNGASVSSDVIISTNGVYTLTASNNGKKQTIYFTVAIPNVSTYSVTVTDAKIAIDDNYDTVYLYNHILSGVRVYNKNYLNQSSDFVRTQNGIISHAFFNDSIAFIHNNGVSVFDRKELSNSKNASSVFFSFNGVAKTAAALENLVYYVIVTGGVSKFYRMNLFDGSSVLIDTVNEEISFSDLDSNAIILSSVNGNAYIYNSTGFKTNTVSISKNSKGIVCGNGILYDGIYAYSINEGKRLFSTTPETPITIIDGYLLTDRSVYSINSMIRIGRFENTVTDIALSSDGKVYKCLSTLFIERISASSHLTDDNILASLNAAKDNSLYISNPYDTSVFTQIANLPSFVDISDSVVVSDANTIFAISPDEQRLYAFNNDTLKLNKIINLRFAPSSVCTDGDYIFVVFSTDNYVLKISITNYHMTYYSCARSYISCQVMGKELYALTESGDLFSHKKDDPSSASTPVIRFQNVTSFDCADDHIYVLLKPSTISFLYKISPSGYTIEDTAAVGSSFEKIIATSNLVYINNIAYYSNDLSVAYTLNNTVIYADDHYVLTDDGLYLASGGILLGSHRYDLHSPVFDSEYNCYSIYNNTLLKIKNTRHNLHELPEVGAVTDGDTFKGAVLPTISFGYAYIDGERYIDGTYIENGGRHTLIVAQPFGVYKSLSFTIEAKITSISLSFGKNTISVNETLSATIGARPTTYGNVDVIFTTDNDNVIVYPDGTIIGVAEGECTVTATTADEMHSSSVILKVLPTQIVFDSSYFNERNDGYVDMIPPGTSVDTLKSAVASTFGNVYVTTKEGSEIEVGVLQTGMFVVLCDPNGNEIDKRSLSVIGDVDCDGYTTANDYYVLEDYLSDFNDIDSCVKISADIDQNGEINAFDLLALKEHILGENPFVNSVALPSRVSRAVPKLMIPKELAPGTNFSVALTVENAQNVSSISANIVFDSRLLTVNRVTLNGVFGGYYYNAPGCLSFFSDCDLDLISEVIIVVDFNVVEFMDINNIDIECKDIIIYDGDAAKCNDIISDATITDNPKEQILIFNLPDFAFDSLKTEYSIILPAGSKKIYAYAYPENRFTLSGSTTFVDGVADFFAVLDATDEAIRYSFLCTSEQAESPETNKPDAFKDNNTYISSIEITGGSLSPTFNKNVKEYYIVTELKDNVIIDAMPESLYSTVHISELVDESGVIKVTCTAENGDVGVYVFHITESTPVDMSRFNGTWLYKVIWIIVAVITTAVLGLLAVHHYRSIVNKKNK